MITTTQHSQSKKQRDNYNIERVRDLANQRLLDSGYCWLGNVSCHFQSGVLILEGKVPSFYMKQLAQSLVRNLEKVEQIENRLVVTE